jgi:hypothetical protein
MMEHKKGKKSGFTCVKCGKEIYSREASAVRYIEENDDRFSSETFSALVYEELGFTLIDVDDSTSEWRHFDEEGKLESNVRIGYKCMMEAINAVEKRMYSPKVGEEKKKKTFEEKCNDVVDNWVENARVSPSPYRIPANNILRKLLQAEMPEVVKNLLRQEIMSETYIGCLSIDDEDLVNIICDAIQEFVSDVTSKIIDMGSMSEEITEYSRTADKFLRGE